MAGTDGGGGTGESVDPRRAELVALFMKIASEVIEKEFVHVEEKMAISELGIDSLGMLEIIGSLERELKIQIPDENLAGVTTIKDLLDVVESRMVASAAGGK